MLRSLTVLLAPLVLLLAAGLALAALMPDGGMRRVDFSAATAPPLAAPDRQWQTWIGEVLAAGDLALPNGPIQRWPGKLRWGHVPRRHVDVTLSTGHAVHVAHLTPTPAGRLALLARGDSGRLSVAVSAAVWLAALAVALASLSTRSRSAPAPLPWQASLATGAVLALAVFLVAG